MKAEILDLLEKAISKAVQGIHPIFSAECITLRSPQSGRTRKLVTYRMPHPFDGWFYQTGIFYVPVRYEKKIKGVLFQRAENQDALLNCDFFISKISALAA